MRVKLSDDRKARIEGDLIAFWQSEFDEAISEFQAAAIVDFMLRRIGPSQYNQAIADARGYMARIIDEIDTEFHEPE
jgi:uncharacterized protein (DUF2164 family)